MEGDPAPAYLADCAWAHAPKALARLLSSEYEAEHAPGVLRPTLSALEKGVGRVAAGSP